MPNHRRDADARRAEALTWELLCQLEPGLLELHRRAAAVTVAGRERTFCANEMWYGHGIEGGLRGEVIALVGFRRKGHQILGTREAYDLAYQTIYRALPDCTHPCWLDCA